MVVIYKNVKMKNKKTGKMEIINPYTPEELEKRRNDPNVTPQTILKGLGKTAPSVKNPKTGVWESPFTFEQREANRIALGGQRQKAIDAALLDAGKTPTQEMPQQENIQQQPTMIPGEEVNIDTTLLTPKEFKALSKEDRKKYSQKGTEELAGGVIRSVAEVYDFVQSLFSEGKSIQQKTYESEFADVKSSINNQVNLYAQGLGDAQTIRENIATAERININFEASAKNWSNKGLRYYLTDGKDILIQTELNKQLIESWKIQLLQAEQQATLKRLRGQI